ncbi:MAG: acyl-CoA-binding protein [Edaphocola sp.]
MENIAAQFEHAATDSKALASKPDNDTLLQLYSLYKQATLGDAPADGGYGMFDFVAKAKHEAWKALQGLGKDEAMQQYVELVNKLKQS